MIKGLPGLEGASGPKGNDVSTINDPVTVLFCIYLVESVLITLFLSLRVWWERQVPPDSPEPLGPL